MKEKAIQEKACIRELHGVVGEAALGFACAKAVWEEDPDEYLRRTLEFDFTADELDPAMASMEGESTSVPSRSVVHRHLAPPDTHESVVTVMVTRATQSPLRRVIV